MICTAAAVISSVARFVNSISIEAELPGDAALGDCTASVHVTFDRDEIARSSLFVRFTDPPL